MCCGQTLPNPGGRDVPSTWVRVRYRFDSPILVRGPATGRRYDFSADAPVQAVELRDAEALLRTRYFRIES